MQTVTYHLNLRHVANGGESKASFILRMPIFIFLSLETRTGRWPLWLRGEPSWQAIQGMYATQHEHRHKESPNSTSSIGLKKLLSPQILVRYSWKDITFLIAGVVHASAYCSRLFSSCLSSFKVHDFTLRCTCAFRMSHCKGTDTRSEAKDF